jgi:hypothetical protein
MPESYVGDDLDGAMLLQALCDICWFGTRSVRLLVVGTHDASVVIRVDGDLPGTFHQYELTDADKLIDYAQRLRAREMGEVVPMP